MPACLLMVLSLAVALLVSSPRGLRGQEEATPPRLITEDFDTEPSERFELEGEYTWKQGAIVLSSGANLRKKVPSQRILEIRTRLEFAKPEATSSRTWFEVQNCVEEIGVELKSVKQEDQTVLIGSFLLRKPAAEGIARFLGGPAKEKVVVLRKFTIHRGKDNALTKPIDWVVRFRYGLLEAELNGKRCVVGYAHNDYASNPALAVKMEQRVSSVTCDRVAINLKRPAHVYGVAEAFRQAAFIAKLLPLVAQGRAGQVQGMHEKTRQLISDAKQSFAKDDPIIGHTQTVLGELARAAGDYQTAREILTDGAESLLHTVGKGHPYHALNSHYLGSLYSDLGDYVKAEPLLRESMAVRKEALGEQSPEYAASLDDLGWLYVTLRKFDKAEPLLTQAAEIREKLLASKSEVLFERRLEFAESLDHLSFLYFRRNEFGKAESQLNRSLKVYRQTLGEQNPFCLATLGHLGTVYLCTRDFAKAKPIFLQELEMRKTLLGERHPHLAVSFCNLAFLHRALAEYTDAQAYLERALSLSRDHLERTAAIQSERQQIAMTTSLRDNLDAYIALGIQSDRFQESIYRHVLAWKGLVFLRQRQIRAVARQPELKEDFAKLRNIASRLSTLSRSAPPPQSREQWQQRMGELLEEHEDLEQSLASQSSDFLKAKRAVTLADVQNVLPPEAVLIDFLEFTHSVLAGEGQVGMEFESHLAAFVIRKNGAPVLVDLGPAEDIAEAVDTWRLDHGNSEAALAAGKLLREKIWLPLEKRVQSAKLILTSRDGALSRFPLAALPGRKPGTYLIEEHAIAEIPTPRALPDLLKKKARPERLAGNILLLGDVDYDQSTSEDKPTRPFSDFRSLPVRGDKPAAWPKLSGSRSEILTIADSYRDIAGTKGITILKASQATEEAVRREAPRHLYLHLATHGFFSPPAQEPVLQVTRSADALHSSLLANHSTWSVHHPGVLSGLVLAGANTPQPAQEDGILTAAEVATLDLSAARLVVLSACETGLGPVAGGEGLLGLQRAFQVAGAQTVIASLWKVPDRPTSALMERYYENLWNKKLSKLDAFREAQLWMMREGGNRGLVEVDDANEENKRLPPFYWAAFVLSGEWR